MTPKPNNASPSCLFGSSYVNSDLFFLLSPPTDKRLAHAREYEIVSSLLHAFQPFLVATLPLNLLPSLLAVIVSTSMSYVISDSQCSSH